MENQKPCLVQIYLSLVLKISRLLRFLVSFEVDIISGYENLKIFAQDVLWISP